LIALGEAQNLAGDPAARQTLLSAARRALSQSDTDALVRAALANSRGTLSARIGFVDWERVNILEAARQALGDEDSPRRARILATLGVELTFAAQDRRHAELSDQALGIARRNGHLETLARVLLARSYTIHIPDTLDERLDNTAELVATADQLGDPMLRCQAAWLRLRCVLEDGNIAEADRSLDMMEHLVEELGQPVLRWTLAWIRTARLLLAGRVDEADALSQACLELGRSTGQPDAIGFFALQQFQIAVDRGGLADLLPTLRLWLDEYPVPFMRTCVAQASCEAGRDDDARNILDEFASSDFRAVPWDFLWMLAISRLALIAAHLGDRQSAVVLRDLLTPYSDQIVVAASLCFGSVAYYLGVLAGVIGDFSEADRHFVAADLIHRRMSAPAWVARTQIEWARTLLSRRESDTANRARELAAQALDSARELGLASVERDALVLLQDCG